MFNYTSIFGFLRIIHKVTPAPKGIDLFYPHFRINIIFIFYRYLYIYQIIINLIKRVNK
jgi:hypothetical protein